MLSLTLGTVACGSKPSHSDVLISNGIEVANTDWTARTVVAIARQVDISTNKSFCSGTLISETAVLTAAHCILPSMTDNYVSFGPLVTDESTWLRRIKKVVEHPGYQHGIPNALDDLAILVLESPAPFGALPSRVTAPTVTYASNQEVVLAGFGTTNEATGTGILRKTSGKLTAEQATARLLTVNGNNNSNTCGGDSGGPVFFQIGGETLLGGVTSWGPKCTFSTESYYVDLRKYVDWMLGVAASENL